MSFINAKEARELTNKSIKQTEITLKKLEEEIYQKSYKGEFYYITLLDLNRNIINILEKYGYNVKQVATGFLIQWQ